MRANLACSFLFIYMTTEQIASAIVNDLYAGNVVKLDDRNHISIEQLEDEVIDCRNTLIKEMYIKEYDERERFIKLKSASSIISILAVGIFIVSILASYINIVVFYTLAITGGFLLLVSLFLKFYWRRIV